MEVLCRLDPNERKRLRFFLQSPYFNPAYQTLTLLELYDYIILYDADETHPMLDKALVFARFMPHKTYQEGGKSGLDTHMTNLFNLVRAFLRQERLQRQSHETEFDELFSWLEFCRKHGLEERFWQVVQALKKLQEERPYRDALYFHQQFKLAEEIATFRTLSNSLQDDANITSTSTYLDTYYSILHLEIKCALQYQQHITQSEIQQDMTQINQIIELAVKGGFEHLPLFELYRVIFQLLSDPDNEQLQAHLENLLDTHRTNIPPDIMANLKAYERYFWIRNYTKSGDPFYRQKLFNLYREHFEQGYFYIDGSITLTSLRMLVVFALKLGHFEWVKKVLDEHPPARICGTRYAAEAHSLNLAEYHFYRQEYDEATEKLQYRLFENPNFNIFVDVLLIKIYMETGDDLLDSRMKALDQKLRRMKLAKEANARYTNFLKKLDKIIRHIWDKKSARYQKMMEELKSTPHIIEREWLLEMLEKQAR